MIGCNSYTVLHHPDVEVYDDTLQAFMLERITVTANCQNCHKHQIDQLDFYLRLFYIPDSSRTDLLRVHSFPELHGYDNYLDSDWGNYYYAVWWFNPVAIELASSGALQVLNLTPSPSEQARLQRLFSRLRSDAAASTAVSSSATTPASSTPEASPSQSERRNTSGSTPDARSSQNEQNAEPTRESGRIRK